MTSTPRRPSAALLVAVAALVLATGSTSYAAGLARNSVGPLQLRTDAVTGSKVMDRSLTGAELKDGTLTGADLRDGSVGAADLAAGVLPRTSRVVRSGIQDTGGQVPVVSANGIDVTMQCDATNHEIDLRIGRAGGTGVELTGAYHRLNASQRDSLPVMVTGGYQLVIAASTFGTNGSVVYDGTARALPSGDTVRLTVGGFVQRGISPSTPTYCDVRVFMAPMP